MSLPRTLLLLCGLSAYARAVVFSHNARSTLYNDLECEPEAGWTGLCSDSGSCTGAPADAVLQPCDARGLVCCPKAVGGAAADVGIKSRQECEKNAKLNPTDECPPLPMEPGKNEASPGMFPHVVMLGFGNETQGRWLCGGVLVSDSYVLTSAVCLGNRIVGLVQRVKLGDTDLSMNDGEDDSVQVVDIDKVYPHPLYKPGSFYHDIALLHLKTPAKLSARVHPACLNAHHNLPTNHFIIAGFGLNESLATVASTFGKLRYVDVTEIPEKQCRLEFQHHVSAGINASMICAGDLEGGRDSCKGDSGSPLQLRLSRPLCQFSIVGISSFGFRVCGVAMKPSVYTRVSEYLQWIESIVWP